MAAFAFFEEGDTLETVLSSLGSVGGFCLLISGIALIMKRQVARDIALWGASACIVAHKLGAFIGWAGTEFCTALGSPSRSCFSYERPFRWLAD